MQMSEEQALEDGAARMIARLLAAWNRGDLEAVCGCYARGAVMMSKGSMLEGRMIEGRDSILAMYKEAFPDTAAMGNLSLARIRSTCIGAPPKAALVDIYAWTLAYGERKPSRGFSLIVLARGDDGRMEILRDASI
jgi:ketosteroid isomerase-like protein